MNKSDIVAKVAAETGMSQTALDLAVNKVLKSISDSLARGDDVALAGFGSFTVRSRKERQGRNPATGATMTIPASKSVGFKPAKALKDAVN
jgi:nucleoid DNA-binding protein